MVAVELTTADWAILAAIALLFLQSIVLAVASSGSA